MKPELRKSLNNLMRIIPGWEDLTDDEVERKIGNELMNLKLIEPLHWPKRYGWRSMNRNDHILNDESFIPEFE